MARVEIRLTGTSGKRTEISIERLVELDAVAEAVGLLLASYGSDIRPALKRLAAIVRTVEEYPPNTPVVDTTEDEDGTTVA